MIHLQHSTFAWAAWSLGYAPDLLTFRWVASSLPALWLWCALGLPLAGAQPLPPTHPPSGLTPHRSAIMDRTNSDPGKAASPLPALPNTLPATNSHLPVLNSQVSTTEPPSTNQPPLPVSMEGLEDTHQLAIGDRLSFKILEDQEDVVPSAKDQPVSREFDPRAPLPMIVTDSGELEIPYLGRYPVVNKTCKQLAREIKTELEKEYYYQATVLIAIDFMTKSRGKVYLAGPVRLPGPQEIPSDEVLTLSKAILRAGGFGDFADRKHVKITRKHGTSEADAKTFIVDVTEIYEKGKTDKDVPLEPGDLIFIPERLIHF